MLEKGILLKTTALPSMVSKVFEKLVNIRIVNHLEKSGLFSNFQFGFRSSWSTANLLWQLCLTELLELLPGLGLLKLSLDISKAFNRIWHAVPFHKLRSYGISGQIFALSILLFSVIGIFIQVVLWMGSLHRNIQLILWSSSRVHSWSLFLLYIN